MGDLAKNHAPAQCLFTEMIGRRHHLIVEEQQQMLLKSQVGLKNCCPSGDWGLMVDRLYECTLRSNSDSNLS